MGLGESLRRLVAPPAKRLNPEEERDMALTFSQYIAQYFSYGGFQYPLGTYLSSYQGTNA